MFLNCKKNIIPIIIIIIAVFSGIFIFETKTTDAAWYFLGYDSIKDMIIGAASNITYYIILTPVSWLLSLSAFLLDWAFGLEKFTDVNIVQDGWAITRGLANMFFILILMIIAFATILRLETYGMKSLLPKLIIAALLINFSLIFCGAIIDFSQILSHFFLDPLKAEGQGDSLSARVAEGLNIVKVYEGKEDIKIGDAILSPLNILIGIIFGVVVILIAALVLAMAAFFLIVRVIALWILIVLAPIAWLLWILPATRSLWNQWWKNFLKWTFFAPIYGFFFYLAIITIIGKPGQTEGFLSGMASDIELGENENFADALFSSQELILQYIFLIGLLFGGLIVAQKLGVLGASGIINMTKKAGVGVSKWTGRKAQRAAYRPADYIGRKLDRAGGWMQRTKFGKGIGFATGGLGFAASKGLRESGRGLAALNERERAAFTKEEERHKNKTSDHLKQMYKTVDGRGKAAIGKILADRGDLKADDKFKFTDKDIEKSVVLAKKYNQQKDIIKARPDLARFVKEPNQTDKESINEAVSKLSVKDMEKIKIESFEQEGKTDEGEKVKDVIIEAFENQIAKRADAENPNQGKIKASHLSKLAETNPAVSVAIQQKIIEKKMEKPDKWKKFETERPDITNYIKSDPGKAIYGDSIPKIKDKNFKLFQEMKEMIEETKKEREEALSDEEWAKKHPL